MKVLPSLRVEVLVKIFLILLSTESSAAAQVASTSLVATYYYYCYYILLLLLLHIIITVINHNIPFLGLMNGSLTTLSLHVIGDWGLSNVFSFLNIVKQFLVLTCLVLCLRQPALH